MIRRKAPDLSEDEDVGPKGFDDFDVRLGDTMRGERATMGKSLLDVQRELRIKAAYVAAIENCDPSAFDTPGFIAGYVRSYARYLNMDPDVAFDCFCAESGFSVAHGMSAEASSLKKSAAADERPLLSVEHDPFKSPSTPFVPANEGILSQIEPRAIGSLLVLIALIAGIGFGGWTVLKQIQQVQVAPVEEAPVALTDLDPLETAMRGMPNVPGQNTSDLPRSAETLDRLYRPQALDVPVLVARDAPISSLDPNSVGTFRGDALTRSALAAPDRLPETGSVADAAQRVVDQLAAAETGQGPTVPQVLEDAAPVLKMVAVRQSWVKVRSNDGTVIYEGMMEPGDSWIAPQTEEPPTLRTGESGAIYFEVANKFYGPVGAPGAVTSNLPLTIAGLQETYPQVMSDQDKDLVRYAEAQGVIIGTDDN